MTVPDNYPLPLQSDVIACLRGKKFITAIDATSSFYQFGVHPPHRDRLTLISPRGLEQPTVYGSVPHGIPQLAGSRPALHGSPTHQAPGNCRNIHPDGTRALCIPHSLTKYLLHLAHDEKHHFDADRMLYDLRGVSI